MDVSTIEAGIVVSRLDIIIEMELNNEEEK
jgi:hypothetical protein